MKATMKLNIIIRLTALSDAARRTPPVRRRRWMAPIQVDSGEMRRWRRYLPVVVRVCAGRVEAAEPCRSGRADRVDA